VIGDLPFAARLEPENIRILSSITDKTWTSIDLDFNTGRQLMQIGPILEHYRFGQRSNFGLIYKLSLLSQGQVGVVKNVPFFHL